MNAFVLYLPSMMLTMNRKGNQNSNHLTLHRRGNFIIRFMKSVKRYMYIRQSISNLKFNLNTLMRGQVFKGHKRRRDCGTLSYRVTLGVRKLGTMY